MHTVHSFVACTTLHLYVYVYVYVYILREWPLFLCNMQVCLQLILPGVGTLVGVIALGCEENGQINNTVH